MRFTRFADIGLRGLMHIGTRTEPISTVELAGRINVSREHLKKSTRALEQFGFLTVKKGRNGGYSLARPAHTVRIGTILRALESRSALVECFGEKSTCPLTDNCPLARTLVEAQEAFYRVLGQYTLQDLLRSGGTTLVQLGDSTPGAPSSNAPRAEP